MKRFIKDVLQQLGENIMLRFDDEQLAMLSDEFDVILEQMALVQKINTENVHSMHFPFAKGEHELRDDDVIENASQEQILANAPETENGYLVINKVVK